ncbi:hypothetical protein CD33_20035 [Ureibacillus sinduriensis BLB-1 = JCM 15800]|uniref:Uncharacterized protein n=1 Tax=Ureibacillus sinduriensis BLB-1 = JCM 15800 TaxID=1384057 RepID=A0A0A3HPH0_9BACL|nr:hypothetical protein CD33_20035 [Ureibacillus sinduriensis BLB-1 = JCM 15800]
MGQKAIHLGYPTLPFYLQIGNDNIANIDTEHLINHLLKKYELLVDKVVTSEYLKNVRVLPQLHTLICGNQRGV